VITPVYNGGKFLPECIESVLSQTYSNWEYTIVNNCSTDNSLEIAETSQRKDGRIKVISNDHFVGMIENHNLAVRHISSQSKYCKVVSADDWLYPQCIQELVQLAEASPSVGVVQSYVINATGVRWNGFPVNSTVFEGRQIARLYLLGKIDLAAPSANLYRSSLVRSADAFFPGSNPSADMAACLNALKGCDFGVVHQILSFERLHDEAASAKVRDLDSYLLDRIELVLEYGPHFLTADEMKLRLEDMLGYYYGVLSAAMVNVRGREYWKYHKTRLAKLGFGFYGARLGKAFASKLLDLLLNPKQTVEKALRRVAKSAQRGDAVELDRRGTTPATALGSCRRA
jgi:glycosyltransferase involved in cell wall biosynthesis